MQKRQLKDKTPVINIANVISPRAHPNKRTRGQLRRSYPFLSSRYYVVTETKVWQKNEREKERPTQPNTYHIPARIRRRYQSVTCYEVIRQISAKPGR